MKTPCIDCRNLKMREYPKHAAVGLGRCAKAPGAFFVSIGRDKECGTFEAASEEKAAARRVWYAQQRK